MIKNLFRKYIGNKGAKNAFWLIGGDIIHKIIAFLVSVATARYLGPANYGLINYASTFTTFFLPIASLGINSVIIKQFVDDRKNEGVILGTTLFLQSISALLSSVFIFLIVFAVDYGEKTTILVVVLSSIGLIFQMFDTIKYWFHSRLKSKYVSIATTISYIISSLYKLLLLVFQKEVQWFALATSIDFICIAVNLFCVYKAKNGPRLKLSKSIARHLIKNSYPYIFSGLMIAIYSGTDKLMLKHMLGEDSVGMYGTAVAIANVWVFILIAIIDSMKPIIMETYNSDKKAYQKKNTFLYMLVFYLSTLVGIFVIFFADFGINVLYGKAYLMAAPVLKIAALYVSFSYMGVARDIWIVCENQQKHLPKIYLGAALLNIVLNFIFIPIFYASGAALASLLTQISTIFITPLFFKTMRPNVKMMADAIIFRNIK